MKTVLFLFSIGLCLTIRRTKRFENLKLMMNQLKNLVKLIENIFRLPNDKHHRSLVRRRRVDACPQLWSLEWTVMLGKTLKRKYDYIGDNDMLMT